MALTNIVREPRREITESMVGVAVAAGPIYLDYHYAVIANAHDPSLPVPAAMFLLSLGAIFGLLMLAVMLVLTHAVGEGICGALARRGLELRPRRRPEGVS